MVWTLTPKINCRNASNTFIVSGACIWFWGPLATNATRYVWVTSDGSPWLLSVQISLARPVSVTRLLSRHVKTVDFLFILRHVSTVPYVNGSACWTLTFLLSNGTNNDSLEKKEHRSTVNTVLNTRLDTGVNTRLNITVITPNYVH